MSSNVMELRDWWKKTTLNYFLKHLKEQGMFFFSKITHLLIGFILPDLWPANSPDLKPVDYCFWGCVQRRKGYTRSRWTMLANWSNIWLRPGLAYSRLSSMRRLTNGDVVLCPCRGTSFWIFVVISTVACLLLTFSRLMVIHVTTVVVSCSRKCRCPGFLTHTHCVNACYEINLSWYPVSSELASCICEHWKPIV